MQASHYLFESLSNVIFIKDIINIIYGYAENFKFKYWYDKNHDSRLKIQRILNLEREKKDTYYVEIDSTRLTKSETLWTYVLVYKKWNGLHKRYVSILGEEQGNGEMFYQVTFSLYVKFRESIQNSEIGFNPKDNKYHSLIRSLDTNLYHPLFMFSLDSNAKICEAMIYSPFINGNKTTVKHLCI